ncbi:MAG TPA: glycosyltransferase, partial [Candidatus Limnocylindrales bacterium]
MNGPEGNGGGPGAPARQRLCLVLPTTGTFDSRTYRIAGALAARGHEVTVLGRSAPGLPDDEHDPAGYRIVRVHVSAVDGMPLPAGLRGRLARRWARRAPGTPLSSPSGGHERRPARGPGASARRALAGAVRIGAIVLTVRSQIRAALAAGPAADLYHGMAYMGIPVALALGRQHGAAVVYDARDIYVDANNLARLPRPARFLLGRVERRWARRAGRVVTVNRPYAEVMANRFGVPLPAIVLNCSYRRPADDTKPRRFHDRLDLAPDARVVLYQGGFSRERGIEQLLAAIVHVPNAALVLMGYGVLEAELHARAADPAAAGRVYILPAVRPAELLDWVASADVVAMPIQPSTLNHRLTTPNKLFEAMAAGVPV